MKESKTKYHFQEEQLADVDLLERRAHEQIETNELVDQLSPFILFEQKFSFEFSV